MCECGLGSEDMTTSQNRRDVRIGINNKYGNPQENLRRGKAQF